MSVRDQVTNWGNLCLTLSLSLSLSVCLSLSVSVAGVFQGFLSFLLASPFFPFPFTTSTTTTTISQL